MISRVNEYEVAQFDDELEVASFMWRLLNFVGSAEGMSYMTGEPRVVVWSGPILEEPTELFLSKRAIEAARRAGLGVSTQRIISKEQLPERRSLVIGDQRDWSV